MEAAAAAGAPLALEVGLILLSFGAAGGCSVSVSQPPVLEVDQGQAAVTVPCDFSTEGCPPEHARSLWFRYGAQQPEALCLEGCTSEGDKLTVRAAPAQNQVSLTVHRPTSNDSAIYVCGIALPSPDPGAKRTGAGTVLVVRGTKGLGKELQGLLIALAALLSLYAAAVFVTLIVLSRSKSNTRRNKETEESQKKKSARRIFQEIAQELYTKRYVGTSRHPREKRERRERDREGEEEQEASTPVCAWTGQAQGFKPATSAFQADALPTAPPQETDKTYENRSAVYNYGAP